MDDRRAKGAENDDSLDLFRVTGPALVLIGLALLLAALVDSLFFANSAGGSSHFILFFFGMPLFLGGIVATWSRFSGAEDRSPPTHPAPGAEDALNSAAEGPAGSVEGAPLSPPPALSEPRQTSSPPQRQATDDADTGF